MVVGIAKMGPPSEEVIVAIRSISVQLHSRCGVSRVRARLRKSRGAPHALRYFVYVRGSDLMNCPVAYVSDLEARVLVEATLHRDVPLPGIKRDVGRVLATGRGTCKTTDCGQRRTVQSAGFGARGER